MPACLWKPTAHHRHKQQTHVHDEYGRGTQLHQDPGMHYSAITASAASMLPKGALT